MESEQSIKIIHLLAKIKKDDKEQSKGPVAASPQKVRMSSTSPVKKKPALSSLPGGVNLKQFLASPPEILLGAEIDGNLEQLHVSKDRIALKGKAKKMHR